MLATKNDHRACDDFEPTNPRDNGNRVYVDELEKSTTDNLKNRDDVVGVIGRED